MFVCMLKSKIHRATVTGADLNYVGSITLDSRLLEAADMLPGEQVHVLNVNTGARFETYTLEGPSGSATVRINGAAARLAQPGDKIIIIAYGWMDADEARGHKPTILFVDEQNQIVEGPRK